MKNALSGWTPAASLHNATEDGRPVERIEPSPALERGIRFVWFLTGMVIGGMGGSIATLAWLSVTMGW